MQQIRTAIPFQAGLKAAARAFPKNHSAAGQLSRLTTPPQMRYALTLRPEGGMPMTIVARTEFADAVRNPAALTTGCPEHHG